MKKIIILSILLIMLTGCYDCRELNDLNIVTAIGFDYVDDEYEVTLEVTKSSGNESTDKKVTTLFSGKDKILSNAIGKAINNSDKRTYFKHTDAILISEDIAYNGISPIMDYLLRDENISTTYFTVIVKNAKEMLDTKIDNDTISNVIVSTITSHINAEVLNNVDIIVSNIINKRKDIALPYVEKDEDNTVLIQDKAYFNKDKMVDTISNKMYNFLYLGNKNIIFENEDNAINIYEKKVKYDIEKDKIIIKVSGEGKIMTLNKDYDISDKRNYLEIQKLINEQIEKEINEFLEETLSNHSDLMGLKDKYYKKYKENIDDISYQVESDIKLVRNGVILEVIYD